jgi:hypothetical protein
MHTQAAPVTSGVMDSPTRRRQAHTRAGPATSDARIVGRAASGAPGLLAGRRQAHTHGARATQTSSRQPQANTGRQRATPPSRSTTVSAHGPSLRGPLPSTPRPGHHWPGRRPRLPPPQMKAVTFRQTRTAPADEGRHLPADEDRPRRRRPSPSGRRRPRPQAKAVTFRQTRTAPADADCRCSPPG